MDDITALLSACMENLDDAAPRLILADYLEEFGRDANWLRMPGYWWALEDRTRLTVSSVIYWRTPTLKERKLNRIGSCVGTWPKCNGSPVFDPSAVTYSHTLCRTWMGRKLGWLCTYHTGFDRSWDIGNALASAESAYLKRHYKLKEFVA